MASSPEDKELPSSTTDLNSEEIVGDEHLPTDVKSITTESDAQTTGESSVDGKLNLILKATSDVPIMKRKKWQVDENKTVNWVVAFIKKYLKLEDKDTIFLYVAQAFAPAPDQQIKTLYQSFGSDGKLVLHYSKTPAWG